MVDHLNQSSQYKPHILPLSTTVPFTSQSQEDGQTEIAASVWYHHMPGTILNHFKGLVISTYLVLTPWTRLCYDSNFTNEEAGALRI